MPFVARLFTSCLNQRSAAGGKNLQGEKGDGLPAANRPETKSHAKGLPASECGGLLQGPDKTRRLDLEFERVLKDYQVHRHTVLEGDLDLPCQAFDLYVFPV